MRRVTTMLAVVLASAALTTFSAASAAAAPSTNASCVAQLIPVLGPLGNPEFHAGGEEASTAARMPKNNCGF